MQCQAVAELGADLALGRMFDAGHDARGDRVAVIGAGLAEQIPLALAPDDPKTITVAAPPSRSTLGDAVTTDVNAIFLIVGAVSLLGGAVGITNVTLLSVMERVGEIGLRRALGATRRQIGAQFTVEAILIGLLSGLLGSALGVAAVVTVAGAARWTAYADPLVAVGGILLGAVVGLAAGWYPSRRAARVEPVTALRAD